MLLQVFHAVKTLLISKKHTLISTNFALSTINNVTKVRCIYLDVVKIFEERITGAAAEAFSLVLIPLPVLFVLEKADNIFVIN